MRTANALALPLALAFASSAAVALAQNAPAASSQTPNQPPSLSQFAIQGCPQGLERDPQGLCAPRACPDGYNRSPETGQCVLVVMSEGGVGSASFMVGGGLLAAGVGVAGAGGAAAALVLFLSDRSKKTVSP